MQSARSLRLLRSSRRISHLNFVCKTGFILNNSNKFHLKNNKQMNFGSELNENDLLPKFIDLKRFFSVSRVEFQPIGQKVRKSFLFCLLFVV
jgi:hypothetical protein